MSIDARGTATTVARHTGPVYDLTPNAVGGVDYLAADTPTGDPAAGVYRLSGGRVHKLAAGRMDGLRLLPGVGGATGVIGADPGSAIGRRGGGRGLAIRSFGDVSTAGTMAVAVGSPAGTVTLAGTATPVTRGGALPPAAAPTTEWPATAAHHATGTNSSAASVAVPPDGGGDVGATCAVPRNDDGYQVPQPSDAQIDWALNLAGQYGLPGRADSYANLHTGAYDPSADFPLPAPFDGSNLPRQIMEGIFAQESNWHQASPHAPAGLSGNPYIADFYGIYNRLNTTGNIDYPLADCGYGLGQVTDMMRLANVGDAPSSLQKRVAVDYAENAAAAAQALAKKWIQLSLAGITVGHDNPMELEDWYFAIWAYNSGVNPQAATGGGGCTPGPSCTDPAGNWGLGWTNNPANATYNPLRHPFLHYFDPVTLLQTPTYGDAAHPQDWPYQEKVYGWMESGQYEGDGLTEKFTPMFNYLLQTGSLINLPGVYTFCDASSHCDPLSVTQPCGYGGAGDPLQYHCWWHHHVDDPCPVVGGCTIGGWDYTVNQPEPAAADPDPSICAPPGGFAGAYIVDDSRTETNLAGCTGMATAESSMVWHPNLDADGQPFGDIDLHQLGTGYGGRTLFTHLEDPSNAQWGGTMAWAPEDLTVGTYDIEVFVPALAAVGTLTYSVMSGGVYIADVPVDQNNYGNVWVSLGTYRLQPGAEVTTTNVVAGGDGATDVAFDAVAFRPLAGFPPPPILVRPTNVGPAAMQVTWSDESLGTAHYEVRLVGAGTTHTTAVGAGSYDWTGLAAGTHFCFQVRAVNSAGSSEWTPRDNSLACGYTAQAGSTPPAPASGVTATASVSYAIHLTWTDHNGGSAYEISNGTTFQFTNKAATSFDWSALGPGTHMCFKIRAVGFKGASSWFPTTSACATTRALTCQPTDNAPDPSGYIDLYHGTNLKGATNIKTNGISLTAGTPDVDFGTGFYVTTDLAQAKTWARQFRDTTPTVVHFRIKATALAPGGLCGLVFPYYSTAAFLAFVTSMRSVPRATGGAGYAFVEGPLLLNPFDYIMGNYPAQVGGEQDSIHTAAAAQILDAGLQPDFIPA